MKYKQTGGKRPTGMKKETPKQMRQLKRKARRSKKELRNLPKVGKKDGGMIEESKEVMFGGPTKKMKKGGTPGALKRAAKKTAKGKANIKKGLINWPMRARRRVMWGARHKVAIGRKARSLRVK